jgi:methionyl-tRNA synthetase
MVDTYYVTTPIYYVNAEPHIGHAYSTIAADILARHMRARGKDVFFLTGTDEHGEPVAQAAEKLNTSPRELADRNSQRFREMMEQIGASNDFFIRTTDPEHVLRVQKIVQRLYDNGYVYEGTYEGWYCPSCADFKRGDEVGPGETCPIHEQPLRKEREQNWFFRLSAFQDKLKNLYEEHPDFVLPAFRRNEAISFIEGGLTDISLSRPKLSWGVPIPWDPSQVVYVWFDALLNYFTALGFGSVDGDLTERFWPPSMHVLAKDILKFHAVIWPALLWAAGIDPPRQMFIHGYLMMGEKKMSKSLGNVLDPFKVIERFGADALRFYCFREVTFGQDGSVSTVRFETRYEAELANDWGNLVNRVLTMIDRYRGGTIPTTRVDPSLLEGDDGFSDLVVEVSKALDLAEITRALDLIWIRIRRLNRYVDEARPWVLAKRGSDGGPAPESERLDEVLYSLAEGTRVVALLLHAYTPQTCDSVLRALAETDRDLGELGSRPGGVTIVPTPPLFPKLNPTEGEG